MAYTVPHTWTAGDFMRASWLQITSTDLIDHEARLLAAEVDIAALEATGGNVVGPASSVEKEVALFDGTTGKLLERCALTGLLKVTAGVASAATAETDYVTPTGAGALSNKTLTGPIINVPVGATSTGLMITKSGIITELTGTGTYTVSITIPALAWIHSIKMTPEALWTAGTSAIGKVGDTADDDGYFIGIDMKATDLVVGEVLSVLESTLWGGKEGAYLNVTTGQRGPVASNFGLYYKAGSIIKFAVVKTGAGTAGRTHCSVTYSIGEVIAQVVT